ncbi:hypothetical protein G7054_g3010 [Neopestalotiopsis clavispora]|nr:hypothetical protein G7054_g3010 [Neopestalotiopsis clavispora]
MSSWPTSTAGPSSSISVYDTGLNDYYQPADEEYDQTLELPIPASHKHTPRSEPTTASPPSTSLYETGYDFYQPAEEEYGQIPELLAPASHKHTPRSKSTTGPPPSTSLYETGYDFYQPLEEENDQVPKLPAPASYKHTPKSKSTTTSTPSTRSKSTTAAPPSTRSKSTTAAPPSARPKSTTAAPPSTRPKSTTAPPLSTPLLSTSLYETGYDYYQPFEEENDQVPELPTPASFKHTPRSRTMNDNLSYNEDYMFESRPESLYSEHFVFSFVESVSYSSGCFFFYFQVFIPWSFDACTYFIKGLIYE